MRVKDLAKVDRPREKLARYGVDKLSSAELLAILLRTGTKKLNVIKLADKILKTWPHDSILSAEIKDLKSVHGIGESKACEIIAMLELGRRLLRNKESVLLLSPQDVWRELRDIRNDRKEHFVVFFLDSRNQEIKREIISVGTLNENLVHPREVFEPAIKNNAAQIIIAHNHPSGDPEPSQSDIEVTRKLCHAGKILDIQILDHIVVSKDRWKSIDLANF